jgi:hypothetical protein
MAMRIIAILFCLIAAASPAEAIYYVSESAIGVGSAGNDSNDCMQIQNPSTPARHPQRAVECVVLSGSGAGKEIRIYPGTYNQFTIGSGAAGSSGGGRLLVRGHTHKTATISGGVDIQANWVQVGIADGGLVLDGEGTLLAQPVNFGGYSNNILTHNEVKRSGKGSNCIGVQYNFPALPTNIEISFNHVHDCGNYGTPIDQRGYGLYASNANGITVKNNLFENILSGLSQGQAVTFYGFPVEGKDIRNVTFSNNTVRNVGGHCLQFVQVGGTNTAFNNLCSNVKTSGVDVSAANVKIDNNTVHGINGGSGVTVQNSSTIAVRNNIFSSHSGGIVDLAFGPVTIVSSSPNVCTGTGTGCSLANAAPRFLDADNDEFRVCSGFCISSGGWPKKIFLGASPAIDAGTDLSATFTDSIDGTTRPQGAQWDISAYETSLRPIFSRTTVWVVLGAAIVLLFAAVAFHRKFRSS